MTSIKFPLSDAKGIRFLIVIELVLLKIQINVYFFFFLVLPLYDYQPISLHPCADMLSYVIPWTSAHQAPLSMDFSRQEYWSGLPFPSPKCVFFKLLNTFYEIWTFYRGKGGRSGLPRAWSFLTIITSNAI